MSFNDISDEILGDIEDACVALESRLDSFTFEFSAGRTVDDKPDAVLVGYTPSELQKTSVSLLTVVPFDDLAELDSADAIKDRLEHEYSTAFDAWSNRI